MKNLLPKDIYQEKRYGKKELLSTSIIVLVVALAILAGGIALIVLGAINPNGAWQIIWRVIVGVVLVLLGGVVLSVSITMFAITKSMIDNKDGNVSDVGNSAKGTINIVKCEKCGAKLSPDAQFCKECGESLELSKCEKCGKEVQKGAKFCEACGKGVKDKG